MNPSSQESVLPLNKKSIITKLLKKDVPFAVIQYHLSMRKVTNSHNKGFEALYYLNGVLKKKQMDLLAISDFLNNLNIIKKVVENKHGNVYEYKDFEQYIKRFLTQEDIQASLEYN